MNDWFRKVVDNRNIDLEELAQVANLETKTVRGFYKGYKKIGRKSKMNLMKILDLTEEDINDDSN